MVEGPPQNEGYMVAAYIVATTLLLAYAALLYLRVRRARRAGATGVTRANGAPPGPP